MNKTFKIAFSLRNTYRVNTILYSLKQIPLIKRLLPQELYRDPDFKLLGEILSGIWEFIKAFLGKFLYFLLMVTLAAGLYETAPTGQIFLHIYVLLTLIDEGQILRADPSSDECQRVCAGHIRI